MANSDGTNLGPIVEAPAETPGPEDPDWAVPSKEPVDHGPTEARQSLPMEPMEARQSVGSKATVEARQSDGSKTDAVDQRRSAASIELEKLASSPSQTKVEEESIRKMEVAPRTSFHIPALVGRPHAGKATQRTRPILKGCNPESRKHFTLFMYAVLTGQVALIALITIFITASISSPSWLPIDLAWIPNEVAPVATTPYWFPQYPWPAVMISFAIWGCMVLCFVALSLHRARKRARLLVVACTIITGIYLGTLTWIENSCATIFICVVLMSLLIHVLGISVNVISCLASSFGKVEPKASKMEMMGRGSCLTGTDKFICLLHDEDAAYTRASLVLAGLSWTLATTTAACVVDLATHWVPFMYAAFSGGPVVLYFAYGVEKQVRRCKPTEKAFAIINLNIDFLFFIFEFFTVELSFLKCRELGSAQPDPVAKGSFQYAIKQVSSEKTQSTRVSSSLSRTSSSAPQPQVTVAV